MIESSLLKNNQMERFGDIVTLKTEGFPANHQGMTFTYAWRYKKIDQIFWVARFDSDNGDKVVLPLTRKSGEVWKPGNLNNYETPLYGLENEYEHGVPKNHTLYILEGEKCVNALQYIGLNATTSIGGASGLTRTKNLSILKGFEKIVIIPDNDPAGIAYAKSFKSQLEKAGFDGKIEVKKIGCLRNSAKSDVCDFIKTLIPEWDEFSYHTTFETRSSELKEEFLSELEDIQIGEAPKSDDWCSPISLETIDYSCSRTISASDVSQNFHQLCLNVQKHLETPLAFIQSVALGVVSAAAHKNFEFQSKTAESLSQPISLYLMTFLKSGERKGPVFTLLTKQLQTHSDKLYSDYQNEMKSWKIDYESLDLQMKQAKKKANYDGALLNKLIEQKTELLHKQPKLKQILGDNLTPEALIRCLKNAPRGLTILSEEPRDFLDIFTNGRYAPKSSSQFDILLKAYDGSNLRLDRATPKGQGNEAHSEFVKDPRLSILISGQPHIINSLTEGELASSGFLARFNIVCPPSLVGKRKNEMINNPTPHQDLTWFNSMIRWILDYKKEGEPSVKLMLSADAESYLEQNLKDLETQFNTVNSSEVMSTKANKLSGLSVRISCLLHLIETFSKNGATEQVEKEISLETHKKAWNVISFFLEHHRVLEKSYSKNINFMYDFYNWLQRNKIKTVTKRELDRHSPIRRIRDQKGLMKCKKESKIKEILKQAEDYYWIQKVPGESKWRINPKLEPVDST